jgi:hypothetical protein
MATQTMDGRDARHSGAGLLQIDPEQFNNHYNQRPFTFTHKLHEHPLMQLGALVDLANRLPADQVRHSRGKRGLDVDFDDDLRERRHKLSFDEVLGDLQHADAYIMLHRPDTDPEYRDLLFSALGDLRALTEAIDPGMCDEAAFIFVASPGAVTPYHMDREVNFHCQIRGEKVYSLWDQDDRSILSESDIEQVFARADLPKPGWKEEYAQKVMQFALGPGIGVQQPLLAPHAVTVRDELSIAIALTFRTRSIKRRIGVHTTNYKLRRMGFKPGGYNQSPLADSLKFGALRGYHSVRDLANRRG